jgi:hypothetical protein
MSFVVPNPSVSGLRSHEELARKYQADEKHRIEREEGMSRRILIATTILIAMAALAIQAAVGARASSHAAAPAGSSMGMGPMHMISEPAFQGFYDGKKYTYINTDVSNKAQAAAMHINYSSFLASVKGAPAIYLFEGRTAAGQIAAFGSVIGDPSYAPLWEEMIVKWKAGVKPTLLTSDNAVLAAQQKGKLTVADNHIVLNCPMIKGK